MCVDLDDVSRLLRLSTADNPFLGAQRYDNTATVLMYVYRSCRRRCSIQRVAVAWGCSVRLSGNSLNFGSIA